MRIGLAVAMSLVLVGCLVPSVSMPAGAAVDMYDGRWHFTLAPYVWLPTINGTLNLQAPGTRSSSLGGLLGATPPPGTTVAVTLGPSSYLSNLNFAFLGYFEARKSNWSLFTDVIDISAATQKSSVTTVDFGRGPIQISPSFNTNTSASFSSLIATLAVGYTVVHKDMSTLDVFGGGQYINISASVNWSLTGPRDLFPQSGSLGRSQELLAGVAGIKGNLQLGTSRWFVPYFFDVGTGGFSTWQAMAGIGYAFSWGDVALTYRHLYVDTPSGNVIQNTTLDGPMLGVVFHW